MTQKFWKAEMSDSPLSTSATNLEDSPFQKSNVNLDAAPQSQLKKDEEQIQSQAQAQAEVGSERKVEEFPTERPLEEKQMSVSGLKRALIIMPTTLVHFLVMLDSSIISTAIPQITDEFDSLLDVGWYGSAYQLASSAFVPLAGRIYTLFSIKVSYLLSSTSTNSIV